MNQFNRWQRIAIVLSLVWFGLSVWYFWEEYPTADKVSTQIYERRSKAETEVGRIRDEALRQCQQQNGDDPFKELRSGCTRDAQSNYLNDFKRVFEGYNELAQMEFERLPARQNAVLLKMFLVGALLPLLAYLAVAWIARAPGKKERA